MKKKRWIGIGLAVIIAIVFMLSRMEIFSTKQSGISSAALQRDSVDKNELAKVAESHRTPRPSKILYAGKSASDASDDDPRQLAEIDPQHPGFRLAYQTETLKAAGKVISHCVQLLLERDATESAVRDYEMVETYRNDGHGNMVLDDVDITPESSDDSPEFYDCIAATRKNTRISIPTSLDMKMGAVIRVYDAGRVGIGPLTTEYVAEVVAASVQQIADMERDDPYRPFVQHTLDLFRCYQTHGVDTKNRLRCLRIRAGDEPGSE